jgi:hypothetical protein
MQEDTAMHVLMTPILGRTTAATEGVPLDGELAVLPVRAAGVGDVGVFRDRPLHFVGLDSHADVRMVEVAELDVTPDVVLGHVQESAARDGPRDARLLDAVSAQMLHVAAQFPVGSMIRRDSDVVRVIVPIPHSPVRGPVCDPSGGGTPW